MDPPGVGKTSLGKSIAKATNRQFVRMSVRRNVRDEAEDPWSPKNLHWFFTWKNYSNDEKSWNQKSIYSYLDEIDKVGNDYRGDPSSALLEALRSGAKYYISTITIWKWIMIYLMFYL